MPLILTPTYVHKAPFQLDALGIELPEIDEEHPNRVPFRGILTRVDEPSTRAPNGSQGHRVLIPRQVAEEALPSLIGMPINFADGLADHDKTQAVGTIAEAHLDDKDLIVSGYLFSKNFPNAVADIQRRKGDLGQSYEISDVHVADTDAEVWTLTHLLFTGAAILKKDAAAYAKTSIEAKQEEWLMPGQFDTVMAELKAMGRKLDAARKDDDEDAKRREEEDEDAKRREDTDAKRRDEDDEEDAKRKDEDDEDAKRRDEDDEEDAKRRGETEAKRRDEDDEDAKRRDEDDEEDAARAVLAAMRKTKQRANGRPGHTPDDEDDDDQMARMGSMFGLFLRGMGYGKGRKTEAKRRETDAARRKDDDDDDMDALGKMLAVLMRGMTYPSNPTMDGMTYSMADRVRSRRRAAAAAHDDEAEDIALFKRLLKQYKHDDDDSADGMDARRGMRMRRVERRLKDLEAAIGLATDRLKTLTGLATDTVHAKRNLATDAYRNQNGGAVRRSMSAAGNERWLGKFDAALSDADVETKMAAIDARFAKGEIDARTAMAEKLEVTQGRNGQ